jgi:hypothetical protein
VRQAGGSVTVRQVGEVRAWTPGQAGLAGAGCGNCLTGSSPSAYDRLRQRSQHRGSVTTVPPAAVGIV